MKTAFLVLAFATLILAGALTYSVMSSGNANTQYVDVPVPYEVKVPTQIQPVPVGSAHTQTTMRVNIMGGQ